MSERKAINKYYPPGFDPSQVQKVHKKKHGRASWPTVRLMVPFSLKCLKCNEYIGKSKKFNARKEVTRETYLGIKIIHLHIRCPRCFNDLIFATDPQNADFKCVTGCKRNFERKKKTKPADSTEAIIARLEEEDSLETAEHEKEKARKHGRLGKGASKETGVEQLERRLKQQQREQELNDEIDELQERSRKLEVVKRKHADDERIQKEQQATEDDNEAHQAFAQYRKRRHRGEVSEPKKEESPSQGITLDYSSSSDE